MVCLHETLRFGSGDFYIYCDKGAGGCGQFWVQDNGPMNDQQPQTDEVQRLVNHDVVRVKPRPK